MSSLERQHRATILVGGCLLALHVSGGAFCFFRRRHRCSAAKQVSTTVSHAVEASLVAQAALLSIYSTIGCLLRWKACSAGWRLSLSEQQQHCATVGLYVGCYTANSATCRRCILFVGAAVFRTTAEERVVEVHFGGEMAVLSVRQIRALSCSRLSMGPSAPNVWIHFWGI